MLHLAYGPKNWFASAKNRATSRSSTHGEKSICQPDASACVNLTGTNPLSWLRQSDADTQTCVKQTRQTALHMQNHHPRQLDWGVGVCVRLTQSAKWIPTSEVDAGTCVRLTERFFSVICLAWQIFYARRAICGFFQYCLEPFKCKH